MSLRLFAELPCEMQNDAVFSYLRTLNQKQEQLCIKRAGDVALSLLLLMLCAPVMLLIAAAVCLDSPGGAIYRQVRVTRYNQPFHIYKFRTMHTGVSGGEITIKDDPRITRVGKWLRKKHLDELPQLYNILRGDLSFVGPRPEVQRYVKEYDEAMMATLLMPAGITSPASLLFAEEAQLLDSPQSERVYRELLLPRKAAVNLQYMESFSLRRDLEILLETARSLFFPPG